MAVNLCASSSSFVNKAPPSPKQPKFLDGKNEVVPILPIVPAFFVSPFEKVNELPIA